MRANFDKNILRERFRKTLYEFSPDVVHFHNIYGLCPEIIEDCRDINVPTIMTLHDYWGICHRNLMVKDNGDICIKVSDTCSECKEYLMLENGRDVTTDNRNSQNMEYYKMINFFIAPSNYIAERYIERGINRERIKVINNGIDASLFKEAKKPRYGKIRLGYVGQVAWHKGIENLINAVSMLDDTERKKVSLIIAGSGDKDFMDYCKGLARGLRFVKFIGHVEYGRIPDIYKKIDILIVPSIWPENHPHSIVEAMASGTPVIASDIGGIPELIDDGINGFLFEHNNPESLAAKIKYVIKNFNNLNNMGGCCVKKAEEINLFKQVNNIIDIYNKINFYN